MSLEPERLAAAFFLPVTGKRTSLTELLQIAGATSIVAPKETAEFYRGSVYCKWADMSCIARLDELSYHHVIQIFFWQMDFLELLVEEGADSIEECGAYPLALAFKRAFETLSSEVAFVVTHLREQMSDYILSFEWMVLAKEANSLADERFGLLYLNEEVSRYWTADPVRDNRDSLPISKGRLVFARRGKMRWF